MELKEIGDSKAGFMYQLPEDESLGTAFITLRLALKSWFCTYQPERYPSYNRLWANGGVGVIPRILEYSKYKMNGF